MQDDYQMFKIVIIGNSATGKSKIATRFVKGQYDDLTKVTVGVQFLSKIITLKNGKQIKVTFWDTAGGEQFRSLSKIYYKGAAGAIIVFDVCEPQTYVDIEFWLKQVNQNLNINDIQLMLIGNKIDRQKQRKITFERLISDYKQRFDIDCFETSAKTGAGIQECFSDMIEKIYELKDRIKDSQLPFQQQQADNYAQQKNENYVQSILAERNKINKLREEDKKNEVSKLEDQRNNREGNKKEGKKNKQRQGSESVQKTGKKLGNKEKNNQKKDKKCC